MRRGVLLDLTSFTDKEELIGKSKVGGSLGCTDHEMVQFRILKEGSRAKSRILWSSGEETWASCDICLEESLERLPWRKEDLRR